MKAIIIGTLVSAIFVSGSALAGDPAAGKARAGVCAACHGAKGMASVSSYPNLAGQNEKYLISAMKAYQNRQRTGGMAGIMQPQVSGLSDTDIENLAAYYAGLGK